MTLGNAIIARIKELCSDYGMSLGKICMNGGVRTTTIYDFMNGRTRMIKVDTLNGICQGVKISLKDFFNREYFDDYQD